MYKRQVVTIIPAGAEIGGCSVAAIIPNGCRTIESRAFEGFTRLTSLVLPETLHNIQANAFDGCSGLTSLAIPAVTTIGEHAFRLCSGLTSLTLPANLRSVAKGAFRHCSGLTSLTLPSTLTTLQDSAFRDCSGLTALVVPHQLTNIGDCAFGGCKKLKSVVFLPSAPPAFVAWAVGGSRNRANWQLTTVMRLRNVLRLVTEFALERRSVVSVDPDGRKRVFAGCTGLDRALGYTVDTVGRFPGSPAMLPLEYESLSDSWEDESWPDAVRFMGR